MCTLSAPSKRTKAFPEMFPLIVLVAEGVIVNEFQLPLFSCAVAVSVVLPEKAIDASRYAAAGSPVAVLFRVLIVF